MIARRDILRFQTGGVKRLGLRRFRQKQTDRQVLVLLDRQVHRITPNFFARLQLQRLGAVKRQHTIRFRHDVRAGADPAAPHTCAPPITSGRVEKRLLNFTRNAVPPSFRNMFNRSV